MIEHVKGDLLKSDCVGLVNTVNCVGVMGKGLALQFKEKFPEMFSRYRADCANRLFLPGSVVVYEVPNKTILAMATKDHWRNPSQIEWIHAGLANLRREIIELGIPSIAMSHPGCGNGGLKRTDVEPLIYTYLKDLPIRIELY